MNHLVVYAHPNPESFCKGILDTVVRASEEKGADVRVRDLYQIRFDPILKGEDLMGYKSGKIPSDIAKEQDLILVDSWELFYGHANAIHTDKNIDFLYLDGIHPNDEGHELIAEALFKQLCKKIKTL